MILTRREFIGSASATMVAAVRPPACVQSTKPRLLRRDSYFGIHMDLHPNKDDTVLGRDITEGVIEDFLNRVKPDYVQYDCKGHPGYAGYPTQVGTPSPGIVKDSLEIWRRVTARNGVALYIHYSGVWDTVACEKHPEWAARRPDGTPDKDKTSTFGAYVDALLIPQLREAAQKYDLDGAWVDGECWAVILDYSPAAAAAFTRETGIPNLPKSKDDPGWSQFLDFNREQFRKYVRHYVEALHASHPKFQIASNWLYSTFVPERPELPVDFLSGDYLGNASISTARLEARYLAATGKPWDLMAWGFQSSGKEHNHKPAVQLMQEASVVLAQGGGFQIYFVPSRAGHIEQSFVGVMEQVARFCRDRQRWCHKSESVAQAAVLVSSHSLYSGSSRMFGGWGAAVDPARGLIDALVESHYSVDVIPDWRLGEDLSRTPLIAVPDWHDIGTEARDALIRYAKQGGNLLLAGAETTGLFAEQLGVKLDGAGHQHCFITGKEVLGNVTGLWQRVQPGTAQQIEARYPEMDTTRDALCAATLSSCGAGRIAAIYGPVGSLFAAYHAPAVREFLNRVVRRVFAPAVEVEGPPTIEVALRRKDGKLVLHLSNSTAMQVAGDYAVNDFVPSVGPLQISLRLGNEPRRVTLEPGGKVLKQAWAGGTWRGAIDRLEIHSMLVFDL